MESKHDVVLKVVSPDPDLDPDDTSEPSEEKLCSFRREIEILSLCGQQQHPNICNILGITADNR